MLKINDRSSRTCLVVDVEGAVTGDEYEDLVETIEDAADKYESVDLVVNLLGPVKYGDMDAVEEDFEFAFKGYRHVRRAAFVGDQRMVRGLMKLFSPFTRTEERFFAPEELDAAIAWACAAE